MRLKVNFKAATEERAVVGILRIVPDEMKFMGTTVTCSRFEQK